MLTYEEAQQLVEDSPKVRAWLRQVARVAYMAERAHLIAHQDSTNAVRAVLSRAPIDRRSDFPPPWAALEEPVIAALVTRVTGVLKDPGCFADRRLARATLVFNEVVLAMRDALPADQDNDTPADQGDAPSQG